MPSLPFPSLPKTKQTRASFSLSLSHSRSPFSRISIRQAKEAASDTSQLYGLLDWILYKLGMRVPELTFRYIHHQIHLTSLFSSSSSVFVFTEQIQFMMHPIPLLCCCCFSNSFFSLLRFSLSFFPCMPCNSETCSTPNEQFSFPQLKL